MVGINFKGHFISAIIGTVLIYSFLYILKEFKLFQLSFLNSVILVIIFVTYTLIPDIDTDSYIQNFLYSMFLLFDLWLIISKKDYFTSAICGLLVTIPIIAHHRGLCHSWIFGLAISLPFYYLNWIFIVPAILGFALHKIGDTEYFRMFS